MALLRNQKTIVRVVLSAGALAVLAAVGLAAAKPHAQPVARVSPPVQSAPAAPPSSSPAVAGAATTAPSPTATGAADSASAVHPAAPYETTPAPPSPHQTVTLQIKSGGTASFNLPLTPDLNACSILTEAKSAGKISSVTLVYYPSYQSDYVSELNGQHDGWTFKYNGTSPPVGCSKVPLHAGDTVEWSYQ